MVHKYIYQDAKYILMAEMRKIDIKDDEIVVTLTVTSGEYKIIRSSAKNFVVLPTDSSILSDILVTGKLGNGNRIMIPNKLLKASEIPGLKKNVEAKIFNLDREKFLLIKAG